MPANRIRPSFLLFSSFLTSLLIHSHPAAGSDASYFNDLRIAESKVLRAREAVARTAVSSHALLTSPSASPLGRPYQVGDWWEVAAIRTESSMMRMTDDPHHLRPVKMQVGIFRYEVIQTGGAPDSDYTVRVRQVSQPDFSLPNFPLIDARIESLELQAQPGRTQTLKRYFFRGNPTPVQVAPEGLRSAMTPLEIYPLDIPETLSAESRTAEELPKIPVELGRAAPGFRDKINLSRALWFEQDDFFGRPVQMLWQKGEPWPAYIKTASGISILIRKGNS